MDSNARLTVYLPRIFLFSSIWIAAVAGSPLCPGFFMISNTPEIGRYKDLYIYAINSDTNEGTIEFSKPDGLPSEVIQTGMITSPDSPILGCYMKVAESKRYGRFRYGAYNARFIFNDMFIPELSSQTYVKAPSDQLNTLGVHTVTIYPAKEGSTALPCPVHISVKQTPGCPKIVWCKGNKRNVQMGPRFTLTSTKDAGLYTVLRPTRGQRGWFAQIRVIAASCPEGYYRTLVPDVQCLKGTVCKNGGVLKDKEDTCICPPFFAGDDCGCPVPPVSCPPGWENWASFCYLTVNTPSIWGVALADCRSRGADLASITCEEEQTFIAGQLTPSLNYWFGLTDSATEGTFLYSDGTEFGAEAYTNWGGSDPDDSNGQDCAGIRGSDGTWADTSCFSPLSHICKMPASPGRNYKLVEAGGDLILCGDLPGGNPKCRGHLVCYGDNYGCKCSSGWWGNACDRPCQKGRYGANCQQCCPGDQSDCDRFLGPSNGDCIDVCGIS